MIKVRGSLQNNISRRNILTIGMGSAALCACSNTGLIKPFNNHKKNSVTFVKNYSECMGLPLAKYIDVSIKNFDNNDINVRIAAPAVAQKKMPIIACCGDDDSYNLNYDLMTGAIAQKDYIVLTIDIPNTPIPKGMNTATYRNSKRATSLRYMLDKLPEILEAYGADNYLVERDNIGVAGYGEGAWTALELIGWGRGFVPSSKLADGRIRAAFSLMPTPYKSKSKEIKQTQDHIIYGRAMVAGNLDLIPPAPEGSNILQLGLPPVNKGFGGLLGKRNNKNKELPQKEVLAASCAAAGMYFDWALKRQNDKLDALIALNGKVIPDTDRQMTFSRS